MAQNRCKNKTGSRINIARLFQGKFTRVFPNSNYCLFYDKTSVIQVANNNQN